MMKKIIRTNASPQPIGPYSQAVQAQGFLFISGQIALDPVKGQLENESVETETKRVMSNLAAILKEAGLGFSHVVKTTIFLTDMADFEKVNGIYSGFFEKDPPARETVAVAGLPKN